VPYEQLHWRTKRLGGFVTAIRYLEIEKMGEENATFSNGELFMGLLVRFVSRDERRKLRAPSPGWARPCAIAPRPSGRNARRPPS
jgi:hypothetical protein